MRACRIVGFRLAADGHWVADLDCGHAQHVRHDPPLESRPWVLSERDRAERVGETLPCTECPTSEKDD
jgi:hypothetical protein